MLDDFILETELDERQRGEIQLRNKVITLNWHVLDYDDLQSRKTALHKDTLKVLQIAKKINIPYDIFGFIVWDSIETIEEDNNPQVVFECGFYPDIIKKTDWIKLSFDDVINKASFSFLRDDFV